MVNSPCQPRARSLRAPSACFCSSREPGGIVFAGMEVYGTLSFASRYSRRCVMNRLTCTLLLLVAVGCCTAGRPSLAKPPQQKRSTTSAVQVDMRNVTYHVTDHVAVHILQMQGLIVPTQRNGLPVFDDVQSFTLAIHYAEIAISMEALSHILNHAVFAAPDAPIKEITVAQVSVKGLLDLLGLTSAQLINTEKVRGVRLEGNDLLLAPALLLPPPHIEGRVTDVR